MEIYTENNNIAMKKYCTDGMCDLIGGNTTSMNTRGKLNYNGQLFDINILYNAVSVILYTLSW